MNVHATAKILHRSSKYSNQVNGEQ
uniref:Uncharacterized protein n=1 Tax=Anguilla anguilla TaxID=7936 RepID=A0A0E9U5M9_ANGAN